HTAYADIYPLSLHDALPIWQVAGRHISMDRGHASFGKKHVRIVAPVPFRLRRDDGPRMCVRSPFRAGRERTAAVSGAHHGTTTAQTTCPERTRSTSRAPRQGGFAHSRQARRVDLPGNRADMCPIPPGSPRSPVGRVPRSAVLHGHWRITRAARAWAASRSSGGYSTPSRVSPWAGL